MFLYYSLEVQCFLESLQLAKIALTLPSMPAKLSDKNIGYICNMKRQFIWPVSWKYLPGIQDIGEIPEVSYLQQISTCFVNRLKTPV